MSNKEPGWISSATFMGLPERFQEAARELARRGEIIIEGDTPQKFARTHRTHEGSNGTAVLG